MAIARSRSCAVTAPAAESFQFTVQDGDDVVAFAQCDSRFGDLGVFGGPPVAPRYCAIWPGCAGSTPVNRSSS